MGRRRFPASSTPAMTHSSADSSYWALSTICWYCSMGTKLSMVRHTSFNSCRKSRMVSSMSSRSCWNSFCRSWISCWVCLCLCQSFSSLAVIFWTWSAAEEYLSSRVSFSSICCSSSSFIRCSCRRLSSTSISARFSSCSCCMAFSITWLPTNIFSCMAFNLESITCCCWASSSLRLLRSDRSSSNFFFSSSATFCCCSMSLLSSATCASISALSASTLLLMRAISSSLTPLFTTFSTRTSFSTTVSTSTISFSSMTSCSTTVPSGRTIGCLGMLPPPPLAACSCSFIFNRMISSWNSRIIASLGSSLMRGLFLMLFAR
mmetsp:Transcript_68132/g.163502  ORF Transcript_68132/g.163502 Transcript_68132/m.163502 type:complete len:319 (+) Transcript_68132:596-1552(+)